MVFVIYVGGRQLDTCRSGIEILSEVIMALKHRGLRDRMSVFVDGGVRRGSDVVKAMILGADGVGIGRPFLYGMSSYGVEGVEKVCDLLKEEIEMTMRLVGAVNLKDLKGDLLKAML